MKHAWWWWYWCHLVVLLTHVLDDALTLGREPGVLDNTANMISLSFLPISRFFWGIYYRHLILQMITFWLTQSLGSIPCVCAPGRPPWAPPPRCCCTPDQSDERMSCINQLEASIQVTWSALPIRKQHYLSQPRVAPRVDLLPVFYILKRLKCNVFFHPNA